MMPRKKLTNVLAEEAFEMDEPEVLLDLRKLNGNPNSTLLDKFWEVTPAVDDCRHGNTLHMPIPISVGDLRSTVEEHLRTKFPEEEPSLPYIEWIRLQFAPRNPYSSNSLRHTGGYDVKFADPKSHPDTKYVMVLLKRSILSNTLSKLLLFSLMTRLSFLSKILVLQCLLESQGTR